VPIHVTNRGVERRKIFLDRSDYSAFLGFLADAGRRFPVVVDGYCLMPNHFHLVLRQSEPKAIPSYLHRVSLLSALRLRDETGSSGLGHVFQRRFWSYAVDDEAGFFRLLRYVEANALRSKLVQRAEQWEWGSLWERSTRGRKLLAPHFRPLPADWVDLVNREQQAEDLSGCRRPVKRGRPPAVGSV
jgi:putative transposase